MRKSVLKTGCALIALFVAVGLARASAAEDAPIFENQPVEPTPAVKPISVERQKRVVRILKAVAYHLKNLSDPDADVRESSCEMLGALGHQLAVGPLIDVLRPTRNEPDNVRAAALLALKKLTGENFGFEYKEWFGWWVHSNGDVEPAK